MDSICYLQPGKVIIELKTTRTTIPLFTKKYIAAVTACRPNVSLYKTVELLLLIVNIHNVEFLCALFVSFYSVFENVACVVGARKAREAEIGIWARQNGGECPREPDFLPFIRPYVHFFLQKIEMKMTYLVFLLCFLLSVRF